MINNVFPASLDHLHEMLQVVSENALKASFESDMVQQIELATEEAIVNIIEHGFAVDIAIECNFIENGIQIKLSDGGAPFNPLLPFKGASKGGYGIPLITRIMDHLEYEYKDGSNILILNKFNRH